MSNSLEPYQLIILENNTKNNSLFEPYLFVDVDLADIETKVRKAIAGTNSFIQWSNYFQNGIVGEFNLIEPYVKYESSGKVIVNSVSVRVDIFSETNRYRITIGRVSSCSSFISWNQILYELVHAMKSFCIPNQGLLSFTLLS